MKIVEKEAFSAVGLKVIAGWKDLHTKMPEAWQQFKERYTEIPGRKHDILMDISLDKEGDTYTQLIAVEVENPIVIADGMVAISIPEQTYVHDRHKGDLQEIAASFGKIYDWVKKEGLKAGEFKLDIGYLADGSEEYHDLYVKINP